MFHRVLIATWVLEDDALLLCTCVQLPLSYFVAVTHLFKADVCDAPQDILHCVDPLPLSQRILLTPNDIEIMRDVIRGVVPRLPLALTLKPGVDVGGWIGISCGFMEYFTVPLQCQS